MDAPKKKLRVMAFPREKFPGFYRAGRFFPAGTWTEVEVDDLTAAVLKAEAALLVEDLPSKARG